MYVASVQYSIAAPDHDAAFLHLFTRNQVATELNRRQTCCQIKQFSRQHVSKSRIVCVVCKRQIVFFCKKKEFANFRSLSRTVTVTSQLPYCLFNFIFFGQFFSSKFRVYNGIEGA